MWLSHPKFQAKLAKKSMLTIGVLS